MLSRFMPREDEFFTNFRAQGEFMVESANVLLNLFVDIKNAEASARRINDIEKKADDAIHKTLDLLHKTFITPLDREDIHALATKMDDIVDFMDATAQRVILYDIKESPPMAVQLADLVVKSAEAILAAINLLPDMKNHKEILKCCIEINRLENESDHIFRSATAKLFREEPDTRQLIKFKEIYEILETTTDRCEEVAHLIEGIVLEYA